MKSVVVLIVPLKKWAPYAPPCIIVVTRFILRRQSYRQRRDTPVTLLIPKLVLFSSFVILITIRKIHCGVRSWIPLVEDILTIPCFIRQIRRRKLLDALLKLVVIRAIAVDHTSLKISQVYALSPIVDRRVVVFGVPLFMNLFVKIAQKLPEIKVRPALLHLFTILPCRI